MKLTSAQQKVIDKAKAEIDEARNFNNVKEYCKYQMRNTYAEIENENTSQKRREWLQSRIEEWSKIWVHEYERLTQNIVLTHCNTKTLEKLAEFGLIEIVYDSTGEHYGVDKIKILNY